jgi:hypothetical protein
MEKRREGGQDGSHAIAGEIDFRPQVLMAILLNEALRVSVTSPTSFNRRQLYLTGFSICALAGWSSAPNNDRW